MEKGYEVHGIKRRSSSFYRSINHIFADPRRLAQILPCTMAI